jgi:hypothetical protein
LKVRVRVRVMVFNTIFSNISVILWRSVLLMEETRVFRENHRPGRTLVLIIITIFRKL